MALRMAWICCRVGCCPSPSIPLPLEREVSPFSPWEKGWG